MRLMRCSHLHSPCPGPLSRPLPFVTILAEEGWPLEGSPQSLPIPTVVLGHWEGALARAGRPHDLSSVTQCAPQLRLPEFPSETSFLFNTLLLTTCEHAFQWLGELWTLPFH